MYHVTQISAQQEEDKPEHNKDSSYDKAPDQNAGKGIQIAYET
jgi:hypothetical protein